MCCAENCALGKLQCSCLENPRDGGAWWAVVSGVAQSRTRLKRLSSYNEERGLFLILRRYFEALLWDRSRESSWYCISNCFLGPHLPTNPEQADFSAFPKLTLLTLYWAFVAVVVVLLSRTSSKPQQSP